jgi:hypothetical protein
MTEHYEPHDRHQYVNGGDILQRLVVLETRFAIMDKGFERLAEAMESTNKEIHEFREMIAKGKGAWWAVGVIIAAAFGLAALIEGAIAFIHKIWP